MSFRFGQRTFDGKRHRRPSSRLGGFECIALACFLLLIGGISAEAAILSPVGDWEAVDDDGKTPTSIIRIYREGDSLSGKIVKLLRPDTDPDAVCERCPGPLKDTPVVGLRILWGMKEKDGQWEGGRILDPDTGNEYSCRMVVEGDRLEVRGFLGFSLFGRTQIWRRIEPFSP